MVILQTRIPFQKVIHEILPDEIYNLAAQSHVGVSFLIPEYTSNSTGLGTLRILETIKNLSYKKKLNITKLVVLNYLKF